MSVNSYKQLLSVLRDNLKQLKESNYMTERLVITLKYGISSCCAFVCVVMNVCPCVVMSVPVYMNVCCVCVNDNCIHTYNYKIS